MSDVEFLPPPSFPKRCACGRTYDKATWQTLRFVGISDYVGFGENDPVEHLDMRNCTCKSTMSVMLPEGIAVCANCHAWIEDGSASCAKCGGTPFKHTCSS